MRFDAAVVIVTVCRRSLLRAVRSVYAQDFPGRVQILVGVDVDPRTAGPDLYRELVAECPPRMVLSWMALGYSTSARHGGVHACGYGGSLRTALSFCADSRRLAYLDDDDWWHPEHLTRITRALDGATWAFSRSWYVNPDDGAVLCEDGLESVGPGAGLYRTRDGGFVRPSALMLDKIAVADALHLWSFAKYETGDGEDRLLFERLLREPPPGRTDACSVYYTIDPRDGLHDLRSDYIRRCGVEMPELRKDDSTRQ
jgi:hypothetical protein